MADLPSARPQAAAPPRALQSFGDALAIWSFGYMLLHLYWALGGSLGFSAIHPSAPEIPQFRAINGWASIILTLAALLGIGLVELWSRPSFHWPLMAIAWCGAAIATAHGLYGIVVRGTIVMGLIAGDRGGLSLERDEWLLWDLFVFEPWFLIEGVLIATAGWYFLRRRVDRYRWVCACVAGTSIALAAAALEFRVG